MLEEVRRKVAVAMWHMKMLPEMRTFHFAMMNAAKTSYLIKGPCRSKTDEKEGVILTSRQNDDEIHIKTYLIVIKRKLFRIHRA